MTLEVVNIQKRYERDLLLKGINFKLEKGEILCLLGPSGSGKSTLLRIIAGLERPDQGYVLWEGQNLENVPVHHRKFSLMFQEYALFPHRTVFENVAFGLKMQGKSKNEIKDCVIERLKSVRLESFANRKVTELSGGEQQRVAFARALAPSPRLLMLDEPLGALDRTLREELLIDLHDLLRSTGVPTIYVTHDQEEAFTLADRVILLNEGIIAQSGTPQEIYHHPINAWAARFLGLKNIIAGKIVQVHPFMVETELGTLEVGNHCASGVGKVGEKVTLLIRPFGSSLAGEDKNENVIEGRCDDIFFQGMGYRIRFRTVPGIVLDFFLPDIVDGQKNRKLHIPPEQIRCLFEEKA